ncbi:MAG TPA: polysaccharide biosynthesis/export family protein [Rhodanobacteraceae bacterium]
MKKRSVAGLVLAATLLLGGCALAPGQRMDTGAIENGDSDLGSHVHLVQITPKLIAIDEAAAQHATIPAALLDYKPPAYRIGPGDVLYITVWDHPELTAPAGPQQQIYANGRLVRPDGTLYYPFVGSIHVAGMTLEQLRAYIAKKLSAYVEQPQVDVNIIQYQSKRVWFSGAFGNPGIQAITVTPLTLAEALGKAKPNPALADLSDLVLQRDGVDYHLDINALRHSLHGPSDIYLKPGDHVFLSYNDHHQIYMMGEVRSPRALTYKTSSMSLSQALGEAGGLNQITSKGKAVYVIRGVADMQKQPATVFQLNARSPVAFALADNFQLKPGDVVFVGAAGVTRWNRFLTQLLPLSVLLHNAAGTQNDVNN